MTDGNIEYIGRNDFQVKLRGFRIELGEIESKLVSYPNIKQAVALVSNHKGVSGNAYDNKYLVGYYVSDKKLDEALIFEDLFTQLPDYMVPSVLVHLDSLPMTMNGKLDRKSLPDPEFISTDNYIAPRNKLEAKICAVYAEVLGLDILNIGIDSDFFKLGGDSILAIKLVSKLNEIFSVNIRIVDIFTKRKVRDLVTKINHTNKRNSILIPLNNAYEKPLMFMIHPAAGGCEVYADLAKNLESRYICYGLDNYNLHNEEKIFNLSDLAKYYLSFIEPKLQGINTEILILGWSLGGLIAAEIVIILEKKGYTKIRVVMLDSVIANQGLIAKQDKLNINILKSNMEIELKNRKYSSEYIERLLDNYDVELKIVNQAPSDTIKNTEIILFKACKYADNLDDTIVPYIVNQLTYNNVDTIVEDLSQINLINLSNATHQNILEQEEVRKYFLC